MYTLREIVAQVFPSERKRVSYGRNLTSPDISFGSTASTGAGALDDHPSSSGQGDHASGSSTYSSALSPDDPALDQELPRKGLGRSGRREDPFRQRQIAPLT